LPDLLAVAKVCSKLIYLLRRGLTPSPQEALRLYPVAIEILCASKEDDVLPLSKPIVGASGRVYRELPVPAGTLITISTMGYNFCVYPLRFVVLVGNHGY
jgi:hypothetical protein